MFIENIQLDRDGEWEKEKKQMTACGARDVVVDASSTTKTGWIRPPSTQARLARLIYGILFCGNKKYFPPRGKPVGST